ncbi:hypothetical protein [Microbacterium sp. NIBRBAC000506063]|uniref:hypothetical protein n=1 Tax=Microbacterium sp. NIBRBAC000506063 TaxID=2734618 RepID=UPI001CB6C827|nr:hypothetical protein [Microbacterium sp. NIBRBAC000506063]
MREAGLFGNAGSHVNVTDGRYVYMRACATPENAPLFDYTLMPMHMGSRFSPSELRDAELIPPFAFTKGVPLLRVPAFTFGNPYLYGTLLFDLHEDPHQERPLRDAVLEQRMATLLVELLRSSDAPAEQYTRLGLPIEGPVGPEHLLIDAQWNQVIASQAPAPRADDFGEGAPVATIPLRELLEKPETRPAVAAVFPFVDNPFILHFAGGMTMVELAAMKADLTTEALRELNDALGALLVAR